MHVQSVFVQKRESWQCVLILYYLTQHDIQDGRTALCIASFNGHDQIVRTLVNAGARIDTQRKVS